MYGICITDAQAEVICEVACNIHLTFVKVQVIQEFHIHGLVYIHTVDAEMIRSYICIFTVDILIEDLRVAGYIESVSLGESFGKFGQIPSVGIYHDVRSGYASVECLHDSRDKASHIE